MPMWAFPQGTPRFGTRSCERHMLQLEPSILPLDAFPAALTAKLLLNIRMALCHCPTSALHSALRATALQLRGALESNQSWRAFGHSSGEMAMTFEVKTS